MMRFLLSLLFGITLCGLSHEQEFVSTVAQNYNERLNHQLQQQISSYVTQEVAYTAYSSYYGRADVALPGFHKFFSSLAKTAREHARNLTTLVNERGGRVRYPVIQLKTACESIRKELRKGEITKPLDSQAVTVSARRNPHICDFLLINNPFTSHKKKTSKHSSWSWWASAKKDKTQSQDREAWQEGLFGLEDVLALENTVLTEILDTHRMATSFKDPLTRHRLEHYLEGQVDSVYRVAQLVERLQDHRNLDTYILEEYLLDSHLTEA